MDCKSDVYLNSFPSVVEQDPSNPKYPQQNEHRQELAKFAAPSWYCLAVGHNIVKFEMGVLGCLRAQVVGVREIVVVDPLSIVPFLENATQKKRDVLGPAVVRYFIENASAEQIQNMLTAGCKFWFSTLTEGDTVFIPGGFIVCDRVRHAQDVIGLRLGSLTTCDRELFEWHCKFASKPELNF